MKDHGSYESKWAVAKNGGKNRLKRYLNPWLLEDTGAVFLPVTYQDKTGSWSLDKVVICRRWRHEIGYDDLCDGLLWVNFFSHSSNIWNFIHFRNYCQLMTAIFHHFNWWTKQEKKSHNKFYPMSARNSWSFFFPLIVQTLNLGEDM